MKTQRVPVSEETRKLLEKELAAIAQDNPNNRQARLNVLLTSVATRMQLHPYSAHDVIYRYDIEAGVFEFSLRDDPAEKTLKALEGYKNKYEYIVTLAGNKYSIIVAENQAQASELATKIFGSNWESLFRDPITAGVVSKKLEFVNGNTLP